MEILCFSSIVLALKIHLHSRPICFFTNCVTRHSGECKDRDQTLTAGCSLTILIRCLVCRRLILRTCSSPWWCLLADLTNRLFVISFLRAASSRSVDFNRECLLCRPLPLTCSEGSDRFFWPVRSIVITRSSFKIEFRDTTLQEKQPSVDIVLSSAGGMW